MRKMLLTAALALGTIMLLGGTPSFAVVPTEMHVTVPFSFSVEGTVLPAGRYLVTNPAPGNANLVQIRSEDGKSSAIVLTYSVDPGMRSPHRPDLVFKNINGTECLAQIWADPGSPGNAIPSPGSEGTATQAAMQKHHARGTQMPAASGE